MGLNLMKGVYLEFVFHQSSTCLTFRKECTHEKVFLYAFGLNACLSKTEYTGYKFIGNITISD